MTIRTRMLPRLLLLTAMLAAMLAVFSACSDDKDDKKSTTPGATTAAGTTPPASGGAGTITVKKGDPIKIGISTTLTTDNAQLGIPIRDAALLALKTKGTIKGFSLVGDPQDDGCAGPASVTAANKLISDGVVAVMGPMCSGGTVAAQDPYAAASMLVVSGSATAVNVTATAKKGFFRVAWNDATQGGEMAKYVYTTLGKKNAILVNDQSVYGKGLMDVFKASFTALGGKVVSEEAVTVGEKDFSPTVTKIKGQTADIVVFGGFIAEGATLVRQLGEAGVTATFMGADGIADQKYIDQAGGKAEGSYVSRGPKAVDTTKYDAFAAAYTAEYNKEVGQFADYATDATNIILAAIESVATVDGSGNLVIDRDELITAMKVTDYAGTTGQIKFNDKGDRVVVGAVNEIDQVTDGKLKRLQ